MISLVLLERCLLLTPNASWQSISDHGACFPGEPEFVMCQFSPFCYPKVKENKMKPWKCHVLITHTGCKHCWIIRYETDMGPELSTAAVDQNFAWICKQHQDLIGSVLIFRTKIIWSGPEFGLVRCGYVNATNNDQFVVSWIKATYNSEKNNNI